MTPTSTPLIPAAWAPPTSDTTSSPTITTCTRMDTVVVEVVEVVPLVVEGVVEVVVEVVVEARYLVGGQSQCLDALQEELPAWLAAHHRRALT